MLESIGLNITYSGYWTEYYKLCERSEIEKTGIHLPNRLERWNWGNFEAKKNASQNKRGRTNYLIIDN